MYYSAPNCVYSWHRPKHWAQNSPKASTAVKIRISTSPPPLRRAVSQLQHTLELAQFLNFEMHYVFFFPPEKNQWITNSRTLWSEQHLHHLMLGSKAKWAYQNRPSRYMQLLCRFFFFFKIKRQHDGVADFFLTFRLYLYSGGAQTFHKSRIHLKILGARWATRSKFHTADPEISGVTSQNLVAHELCTLVSPIGAHGLHSNSFHYVLRCQLRHTTCLYTKPI
jgi:hypothetical protein